jgi:S-DNA-T family DNA segregation ATPase FtsK/SpoIIIE
MVEFSSYKNNIVKDIGYNINDFYNTINNLSQIMNSRYKTFSRLSARNISHYNDLNKERNFMLRKSKMDPIVFVIDEWADIYFEDKNIESRLCSLAQKGRAAGISIVLATQRPSAKVVSGLIKASFPGRISMRTSSAIDSRVIIEQSGAEKIMDPGTGLLKDPYSFSPVLFRTPFVDINIIDKVMEMS